MKVFTTIKVYSGFIGAEKFLDCAQNVCFQMQRCLAHETRGQGLSSVLFYASGYVDRDFLHKFAYQITKKIQR